MKYYCIYLLQSLLLILLTPLFSGILKKFKAVFRGYTGASVFQPYYDLAKLFNKGRVLSAHSSFITQIGPLLSLGAVMTAVLFIPVFYVDSVGFFGDIFVIVFLMAIIKLMNVLIGLDCASTFGGMGSSRELFISMLAEPVLFVILAFLYFETKSFNVFDIALGNTTFLHFNAAHIIAALAFFILLLAENARVPVDNPETHLELTMVHEAMILDLSGSDLAFVELSASIKLMVYVTLFVNCFVPYGIATSLTVGALLLSVLLFALKAVVCLFVIARIETSIAKFRLFRVPELLGAAFSFGIVAITLNYFM